MEPVANLTDAQSDALSSIKAFEAQMPARFIRDPKELIEVFEKVVIFEPGGRTDLPRELPRFEIVDGVQSRGYSLAVLTAMEKVQEVAAGIASLSPKTRLEVDLFARQVEQFRSCIKGEALKTGIDLQTEIPPDPRLVSNTKAKITTPFRHRSFWKSFNESVHGSLAFAKFSLFAGGPIAIASAVTVGVFALAFGASVGALPFLALSALIPAAGFVWGIVIHFLRQKANQKAFADATKSEDFVPLFWSLAPEAQVRLFIDLGPKFREALCKASEEKHSHPERYGPYPLCRSDCFREIGNMIDTLQGSETPQEERKKIEDLFLEETELLTHSTTEDWKVKDFWTALRKSVLDSDLISPPPPYSSLPEPRPLYPTI